MYIKEIHPEDGWQVGANERDDVIISQHQSMDDRLEAGQACMLGLDLEMPSLVDEMDNSVMLAYNGMPERLYLIGVDGKIAYKGGVGPMFFDSAEWREAIESYLH